MSVKAQAFVNFYAALGTLEKFAELYKKAGDIVRAKDISVRFNVKDGPDGVIKFSGGKVSVFPYDESKVDIHLKCASCQKFNDVINGKGMPIPVKGLIKTLKFMGNKSAPFTVLTDEMTSIMREAKSLDGTSEKELSVILSFYAMAAGIAQVANHDPLGQISLKGIANGEISLEIEGTAYATLEKKDGVLKCTRAKAENPRAFMIFDTIETAGGLISGELDAMSCISQGKIVMKGFIPMLENLNKVLNILPKYLA